MMKKVFKWLFVVWLLILAACSNSNSGSSSDLLSSSQEMDVEQSMVENEKIDTESTSTQPASERKIIHHAELNVSVQNIETAQVEIEKKVHQFKGYVVESSIFTDQDAKQTTGMMRVRVPEDSYITFLEEIEEGVIDTIDRTVTGQDVTEEHMDLEARISSKQKVEKRLLQFLDEAEKTEDLLKISNDLAKVQEEIEQLEGQLHYLNNQIDYSTVVISMEEDHIVSLGEKDRPLDTWKKVKQQFVKSTNFLLYALSKGTVFIVGNLPIILIISIIAFFVYRYIRKRLNKD